MAHDYSYSNECCNYEYLITISGTLVTNWGNPILVSFPLDVPILCMQSIHFLTGLLEQGRCLKGEICGGDSTTYHHWKSNNLCLLSRGFLWHTFPQVCSTNTGAGALFCMLICFALLFLPSWCKLPNYANRHTFGSVHFWLNMTRKKPEFLWLPHTFSVKSVSPL